jgi:small multidrug resistance family-3 protein
MEECARHPIRTVRIDLHSIRTKDQMNITRSVVLFVVAGLCEIGGGYLVWLWLREQRTAWLGALGGLLLFLYGVLPTLQPSHFGRIYAAYGGVFVVMSLLWGWWVDGHRPDVPDVVGGAICTIGVGVIMYWPRTA